MRKRIIASVVAVLLVLDLQGTEAEPFDLHDSQ